MIPLLPLVWVLCAEKVYLAANHRSKEETSSVMRDRTVSPLDSLALWNAQGCTVPFTALPSLQQGCFMQVPKVWDSQHCRPCANKHMHYLKRLIQSMMSPTVNHRNFTRKKCKPNDLLPWLACFQDAAALKWIALLTLCRLKLVEIFEWCHSGMRSTCHPLFLPTAEILNFFCFLLARDNWNISKTVILYNFPCM